MTSERQPPVDCEPRLCHGHKNVPASAKARQNTPWMYCLLQPWILRINWARDPSPRPLGDQSGEPERASIIHTKHLCLTTGEVSQILLTELLTELIPLEPELPAVG